jgi:hypothetical protein
MWVGGQRHVRAALSPGKTRYPLYRGLGGPQGRSGQVWKISAPTGARFPERPALSESLYRLSYPGPLDNSSIKMNMECWWNITEGDKSEVFGDTPVQGTLRSPQIPHELECDLTQASVVGG